MKKMSLISILAPLALCLLVSPKLCAGQNKQELERKLVVTNTKDCGKGSLRWAVDKANKCGEPTDIVFDIPKCDPGYDCKAKRWVIKTESSIDVTGDMTIDGFTQKKAKPNTNPPGEANNACVKIVVQSPPAVSSETAKAFIGYLSSLIARDKGLPQAGPATEAPAAVKSLIAKLVTHDKRIAQAHPEAQAITEPLLLPVRGSARIKGILFIGRVS